VIKAFKILAAVLLLSSCKCLTFVDAITLTKAERQEKKCNCAYLEIGKSCPHLLEETPRDSIEVIIDSSRIDTVFVNKPDTIEIIKDRIKTKTIITKDSVFIDVECPADTIYVQPEPCPPRIDPDKITPDTMSWWHKGLIWVGGISLLWLILLILYNRIRRKANSW